MTVLVALIASLALVQQPSPTPSTSPSTSPSPSPSPSANPMVPSNAPKVTVVLGEPTDKDWPVSGSAELPDEKALQVAARRLERRWDLVAERFGESLSDQLRKYATGLVKGRAYSAKMKQGPTGFYKVSLVNKDDDMLLFEQRMAVGRPDKLFTTSVDKVRRLVEIIGKSKAFFEEMIAVHKKEKPATPAARLDFTTRIAAPERELDDLNVETDLTAVIAMLKEVFYHLRNAQIWNQGGAPGEGNYPDQGMFLNPDLSLGDMDKKIKSAAHVLSLEIRLSIAGLLDEHFERAGTDAKKLGKVRDAAKEALKLAAEAPEQDEKFKKLLEKAKEAREEKEIAEVRTDLKAVIEALLRKS